MPSASPSDKASARDYVNSTLTLNMDDLNTALTAAYGDAYVAGLLVAAQQTGASLIAGLGNTAAPEWGSFWDSWKPGNHAAAALLSDGGLGTLLTSQGDRIKGIEGSTLDGLGNLLANGAANGDSVDTIARSLSGYLDDPRRAQTIADTELARAVTAASVNGYASAGVSMVDWIISPGACEDCVGYAAEGPFALDEAPDLPEHPNCCCCYSPRDPGADANGVADVVEGEGPNVDDLAGPAPEYQLSEREQNIARKVADASRTGGVSVDSWEGPHLSDEARAAIRREAPSMNLKVEQARAARMSAAQERSDVAMSKFSKTKPMSLKDAVSGANHPRPGMDPNCQKCVVSSEMRRRGYDVVAGEGTPVGGLAEIHRGWIGPQDRAPSETIGPGSTNGLTGVTREGASSLEELVATDPVGSRYFTTVVWKSEGSHIFSAEKMADGTLKFYDPQTGAMDVGSKYEARRKDRTIMSMFRVDNAIPTPELADYLKAVKA